MYTLSLITVAVLVGSIHTGGRKAGEVSYELTFDKDVEECEDFENKVMDARELSMTIDGTITSLSGHIDLGVQLEQGVQILLTIFKMTPVGPELFAEIEGDMCENLGDPDMPWTPLFDAIGITECPIALADYSVEDLTLSLDFAEGLMNREMVGQYIVNLSLLKGGSDMPDVADEIFACYSLALSIVEVKEDDEDDE